MRYVSLIPILLFLSCSGDDRLGHTCGAPCYDGPIGTAGVGACKYGTTHCDERGIPDGCWDQVTPKPELCDGIDNSCTGTPDQNVTYASDPRIGAECGQVDVANSPCHHGLTTCEDGKVVCTGAGKPLPESCTPVGYDNDCDGVPNDITGICYDGDPRDLAVPNSQCRAGMLRCDGQGNEICYGEVLPKTGNGIDFVFIVDRLDTALDTYVSFSLGLNDLANGGTWNARFAMVDNVPALEFGDYARVATDFVDVQTFAPIFGRDAGSYPCGGDFCEFPLQIVDRILSGDIPLSFDNDRRKVFVMLGQDDDTEAIAAQIRQTTQALQNAGAVLFTYTNCCISDFYGAIAASTGGKAEPNYATSLQFEDDLRSVLPQSCVGP